MSQRTHVYMYSRKRIYVYICLHHIGNVFNFDFLDFAMLGLIRSDTLTHNILHECTYSKAFFMSYCLHLICQLYGTDE